ncbi:TIM barrel protein [Fusibacter sp. JL216-2]|uniref:TIM barrel protein n=1 Tax=Fusibacter sp. JL216-2 TaxID=3071453 RepID=UPI003D352BB3
MINNLGINTVHVDIRKLEDLGLKRVEMCLGRMGSASDRLYKMLEEIKLAKEMQIPFSIHLPMVISDDFVGDYLDVFFLDPDPEKREMSFRTLEENLIEMAKIKPDYCVLHFAGVYREKKEAFPDFELVLNEALKRINDLCQSYNTKVLLEYMGSNIRFSDYMDWIRVTRDLSHVGLITDTGHLYFASLIHGFDYMQALDRLASASEAFHIWTTKGQKTYGESEYYKKYHHIIPHAEQFKEGDWAFDTKSVFERIAKERKPIIIEASTVYKGKTYFYQGIESVISILENM